MNNETYYWTCPYCKANLDPGERCDCRENKDNDVNNYKTVHEKKGDDKDVQKAIT